MGWIVIPRKFKTWEEVYGDAVASLPPLTRYRFLDAELNHEIFDLERGKSTGVIKPEYIKGEEEKKKAEEKRLRYEKEQEEKEERKQKEAEEKLKRAIEGDARAADLKKKGDHNKIIKIFWSSTVKSSQQAGRKSQFTIDKNQFLRLFDRVSKVLSLDEDGPNGNSNNRASQATEIWNTVARGSESIRYQAFESALESVVRAWLDMQFFQNGRAKSEEEILDDMEALEREEKRLENEVKRLEQERRDLEKQHAQEVAKVEEAKKEKKNKGKQTTKPNSKAAKRSKTKTDKKVLKGQQFEVEQLSAPNLAPGPPSLSVQKKVAAEQDEPVSTEDDDLDEEESDEEDGLDFGSLVQQSQTQSFTSVAQEEKRAAEIRRANVDLAKEVDEVFDEQAEPIYDLPVESEAPHEPPPISPPSAAPQATVDAVLLTVLDGISNIEESIASSRALESDDTLLEVSLKNMDDVKPLQVEASPKDVEEDVSMNSVLESGPEYHVQTPETRDTSIGLKVIRTVEEEEEDDDYFSEDEEELAREIAEKEAAARREEEEAEQKRQEEEAKAKAEVERVRIEEQEKLRRERPKMQTATISFSGSNLPQHCLVAVFAKGLEDEDPPHWDDDPELAELPATKTIPNTEFVLVGQTECSLDSNPYFETTVEVVCECLYPDQDDVIKVQQNGGDTSKVKHSKRFWECRFVLFNEDAHNGGGSIGLRSLQDAIGTAEYQSLFLQEEPSGVAALVKPTTGKPLKISELLYEIEFRPMSSDEQKQREEAALKKSMEFMKKMKDELIMEREKSEEAMRRQAEEAAIRRKQEAIQAKMRVKKQNQAAKRQMQQALQKENEDYENQQQEIEREQAREALERKKAAAAAARELEKKRKAEDKLERDKDKEERKMQKGGRKPKKKKSPGGNRKKAKDKQAPEKQNVGIDGLEQAERVAFLENKRKRKEERRQRRATRLMERARVKAEQLNLAQEGAAWENFMNEMSEPSEPEEDSLSPTTEEGEGGWDLEELSARVQDPTHRGNTFRTARPEENKQSTRLKSPKRQEVSESERLRGHDLNLRRKRQGKREINQAKARAAAARGSAENAIKEARLEEIKLMKSLQRDSAAERRKAKMRMIALLRAEKAEQLALKLEAIKQMKQDAELDRLRTIHQKELQKEERVRQMNLVKLSGKVHPFTYPGMNNAQDHNREDTEMAVRAPSRQHSIATPSKGIRYVSDAERYKQNSEFESLNRQQEILSRQSLSRQLQSGAFSSRRSLSRSSRSRGSQKFQSEKQWKESHEPLLTSLNVEGSAATLSEFSGGRTPSKIGSGGFSRSASNSEKLDDTSTNHFPLPRDVQEWAVNAQAASQQLVDFKFAHEYPSTARLADTENATTIGENAPITENVAEKKEAYFLNSLASNPELHAEYLQLQKAQAMANQHIQKHILGHAVLPGVTITKRYPSTYAMARLTSPTFHEPNQFAGTWRKDVQKHVSLLDAELDDVKVFEQKNEVYSASNSPHVVEELPQFYEKIGTSKSPKSTKVDQLFQFSTPRKVKDEVDLALSKKKFFFRIFEKYFREARKRAVLQKEQRRLVSTQNHDVAGLLVGVAAYSNQLRSPVPRNIGANESSLNSYHRIAMTQLETKLFVPPIDKQQVVKKSVELSRQPIKMVRRQRQSAHSSPTLKKIAIGDWSDSPSTSHVAFDMKKKKAPVHPRGKTEWELLRQGAQASSPLIMPAFSIPTPNLLVANTKKKKNESNARREEVAMPVRLEPRSLLRAAVYSPGNVHTLQHLPLPLGLEPESTADRQHTMPGQEHNPSSSFASSPSYSFPTTSKDSYTVFTSSQSPPSSSSSHLRSPEAHKTRTVGRNTFQSHLIIGSVRKQLHKQQEMASPSAATKKKKKAHSSYHRRPDSPPGGRILDHMHYRGSKLAFPVKVAQPN